VTAPISTSTWSTSAQWGHEASTGLLSTAGGSRSLAHELAVHIAFARPVVLRRDELPAAELEEERATLLAAARNEGKPEAALEKVVEGRLTGWIKERCLLEQPYVRDEKRTVAEHLGSANVVRFAQVEIGA
jgi:elongation factor Ts